MCTNEYKMEDIGMQELDSSSGLSMELNDNVREEIITQLNEIPVTAIPHSVKIELDHKLNPKCALGSDWRAISEKLGFAPEVIPYIDSLKFDHGSNFQKLLEEYSKQPNNSVGALTRAFQSTRRHDARDIVIKNKDAIIDGHRQNQLEEEERKRKETTRANASMPTEHSYHTESADSHNCNEALPEEHLFHRVTPENYQRQLNVSPDEGAAEMDYSAEVLYCLDPGENPNITQSLVQKNRKDNIAMVHMNNRGFSKDRIVSGDGLLEHPSYTPVSSQGKSNSHTSQNCCGCIKTNKQEPLQLDIPSGHKHDKRHMTCNQQELNHNAQSVRPKTEKKKPLKLLSKFINKLTTRKDNCPENKTGNNVVSLRNNTKACSFSEDSTSLPGPVNHSEVDHNKGNTYPKYERDEFNLSELSNQLRTCKSASAKMESGPFHMQAPKLKEVFITYPDDKPHMRYVFQLMDTLRKNRFKATADEKSDEELPAKIKARYERADFILVCITPKYIDEINQLTGTQYISNHHSLHTAQIYKLMLEEFQRDRVNHRFIPLLLKDTGMEHVPVFLKQICPPCIIYQWPTDYNNLFYHLLKPQELVRRYEKTIRDTTKRSLQHTCPPSAHKHQKYYSER